MLKLLGNLYKWVWYHTEFWITKKLNRRPYTYIMQDWIFTHPNLAVSFILAWFAGMVALSIFHGTLSTVLSILSGLLTAHLVWGGTWIKGQQESPPYNPDER